MSPYDAYMEVPYKNVDRDTKKDLPATTVKRKDREIKRKTQ